VAGGCGTVKTVGEFDTATDDGLPEAPMMLPLASTGVTIGYADI
jgi:hypothetical protein